MAAKDTYEAQDIAEGSLGSQPNMNSKISRDDDEKSAPSSETVQGKELRRKIGPVYAIAYVVGVLIGSGIFVSFQNQSRPEFMHLQTTSSRILGVLRLDQIAFVLRPFLCIFKPRRPAY